MTSEEIQKLTAADLSTNSWLREIAYQLALRNEMIQTTHNLLEAKRPGKPRG